MTPPFKSLFYQWSGLMQGAYGSDAPLLIAYTVAAAHREAFSKKAEGFPLLALSGLRNAGKTTLGRSITAALGSELHFWRGSTILLNRLTAAHPGQAFLIDEYRGNVTLSFNKRLRDFYDFPEETQPHLPTPKCVVISGDEVSVDPVLKARCILVKLDVDNRPSDSTTWLKTLRDFEQKNLGWLVSNEDVTALISLEFPVASAYFQGLERNWKTKKGQAEHLAMLHATASALAGLDYRMTFSPHELHSSFLRHNCSSSLQSIG